MTTTTIPQNGSPSPSTALALSRVALPSVSLLRPIGTAEELVAQRAEIVNLLPRVLTQGVDIIRVPGTDKDCLSKAGAERCAIIFGCRPEYEIVEQEIDHERPIEYQSGWVETVDPGKEEKDKRKALKLGRNKKINGEWQWQEKGEGSTKILGLYRYVVRCRLVRQDGLVVGDGVGACSTLETKYCDRPRDCENTVLKMAQKRAFVGVVLNAFGLSDRFTGDLDDGVDHRSEPPPREATAAAPRTASTPKTAPTDVLAHAAHVLEANDLDTLTSVSQGYDRGHLEEKIAFAVGALEQLRALQVNGADSCDLDERSARAANWLLAQLPRTA